MGSVVQEHRYSFDGKSNSISVCGDVVLQRKHQTFSSILIIVSRCKDPRHPVDRNHRCRPDHLLDGSQSWSLVHV